MKVYVAAASSEIERAEHWISELKKIGVTITCTWPESVRSVGAANPPEATLEQRTGWAMQDLAEVREADVFWFLLPSPGHSTSGAWTELGCASETKRKIVMSGESHSVFVGLCHAYCKTDQDAFDVIRRVSR